MDVWDPPHHCPRYVVYTICLSLDTYKQQPNRIIVDALPNEVIDNVHTSMGPQYTGESAVTYICHWFRDLACIPITYTRPPQLLVQIETNEIGLQFIAHSCNEIRIYT